ncbi:hypothetical protein L9F63_011018, partial [Diploptera punctata]
LDRRRSYEIINCSSWIAAVVFPCQTSKAYDLGHLQCLALLLALLSSCFPSICFGHRSSSNLKICPNHFNSFSSILSIMLSSASTMFLISLFILPPRTPRRIIINFYKIHDVFRRALSGLVPSSAILVNLNFKTFDNSYFMEAIFIKIYLLMYIVLVTTTINLTSHLARLLQINVLVGIYICVWIRYRVLLQSTALHSSEFYLILMLVFTMLGHGSDCSSLPTKVHWLLGCRSNGLLEKQGNSVSELLRFMILIVG